MKIIAIIPTRYGSTRFPGKPLAKLKGKYIIQHVYEQAVNTGIFADVVIGTDDLRIFEAAGSFNARIVMTSKQHQSGTDRITEVCRKIDKNKSSDIVVNIQGDEPFIKKEPLQKLVDVFQDEKVSVASLMHQITDDITNPNIVKVVIDKDSNALYFSRSVIPFSQNPKPKTKNPKPKTQDPKPKTPNPKYFKHIGVYAFRKKVLYEFVDLAKSKLEEIEKLEQLRFLENGIKIKMVETSYSGIGIDTPEDLKKAEKRFVRMT